MSEYKIQAEFTANTTEATAKVQEMQKAMTGFQNGVNQGSKMMNNNLKSTRFAITNVNWVVRDSPYLFNNFSMGVMALSNNIGPMIDGFQMVIKETGSMKAGIRSLWGAMMGPMGLSIAFSVVIAAIQAYSFLSAKASRETKAMGKSGKGAAADFDILTASLEDVNKQLKDMTSDEMKSGVKALTADIENLRKKDEQARKEKERYATGFLGLGAGILPKDPEGVKDQQKKIDLLTKEVENVTKLGEIKNKIKVLEEQRNAVLDNDVNATAKIRSYTDQIVALENQRKEIKSTADLEKEREERARKMLERAFEGVERMQAGGSADVPGLLSTIPTVEQVQERLNPVEDFIMQAYGNIYGNIENMGFNMADSLQFAIVDQWQYGISAMKAFEQAFTRMLQNMVAQLLSRALIFGFLNIVSGGAIGFAGNVFSGFNNLTAGGVNPGLLAGGESSNLSLDKTNFLLAKIAAKDTSVNFNGSSDWQTVVREFIKPEMDLINRKAYKS